jgi:3-oxoacyl-[acyl-carrier protein] reductase
MTPEMSKDQASAPLAGKTALVLGGSRGIGNAIVQRLAIDGAGVALTYSGSKADAEGLVQVVTASGGVGLAICADSAVPQAVKAAVERTVSWRGGLDIVVVNAGILMRGTIEAFSIEDFDALVAVNLRGVFAALHYAAPHIRDGGRIITIGSNTALRTAFPGISVYSATKAAVAVLVRGVAIDLAPRRITVNNVQPGPTTTDMTTGGTKMITPLIPLGRMGEPAEIASLVAYLAREEAAFVTGASLTVDGGYVA